MAGRRSWPAMATVLLALLVCLGELVDSKPQPSDEKASPDKHHRFSLSRYAKLANRPEEPNCGEDRYGLQREICQDTDPISMFAPDPGTWILLQAGYV
ncbi:Caltrin [Bos mutus]|uniref:Caltrin n=1 Tax=Bos mutus TaxID=72004 RepID=L8HWF7_9CETA|nr:Caltrin [Bos mutus]